MRARRRKKLSQSAHHTMSELNITPLLDLAFVLLVIFIITTAPAVNDIAINLPSAANNPKDPPPKINNLTVDEKGNIFLNSRPMPVKELRDVLIELLDLNGCAIERAGDHLRIESALVGQIGRLQVGDV